MAHSGIRSPHQPFGCSERKDNIHLKLLEPILKVEILAATVTIMASVALTGFQTAIAQVLDRDVEAPTPGLNGTASTGTPDVSIDISPLDPLPINGTVTMNLEDVVDTNMNEIPPQGITVIISNESVTVTNHDVTIEETETEEPDPTQVTVPFSPAVPSESPTEQGSSGSGGGNDDEGSADGDDDGGDDDGVVVGGDDDEGDEG